MKDTTPKACRLSLSGVESRRLLDTFAEFRVPNIQVSYYYLRKVFDDPAHFVEFARKFETVIIDHGLIYHKYNSEEEKQRFLRDYDEYVAKLPRDAFTAVVAHPDTTLEQSVDTQNLIYPLEDLEGVFEGDMKAIFSQIEYIGISNKVANNEERMGYLASQASHHGVKLHAFGTSSIKVLKKWPFYSANSSSWRTGSRYANTYIYEGPTRGLKIYQPTDKADLVKTDIEKRQIRTRLRRHIETRQPILAPLISWDKLIEEDDSWEVDKANLAQWILYQRDLELDLNKNRYYLTDQERDAIKLRKEEMLVSSTKTVQEHLSQEQDEQARNIAPPDIVQSSEIEVIDADTKIPSTTRYEEANDFRLKPVDPRAQTLRKCEDCILAGRCPKYMARADGLCSFGLSDAYLPNQLDEHIDEDVGELMAVQRDRIMQGYLEEKVDAAGFSKDLTNNIRLYLEMVQMHRDSKANKMKFSVEAKGSGIMEMFKPRDNKGG